MARRLCLIWLMLADLLLTDCSVSEAQTWPNEPAGATVLSDQPWNNLTGAGWTDEGGDRRIISDPSAPLSPTNVLESRRLSGSVGGANEHYYLAAPVDNLYFGFWWKPSNPFPGWENGAVNKFAMVRNAHGSGHGYLEFENGTGARCSTCPYNVLWAFGYGGVSNSHLETGWGDPTGAWNLYPNRGAFTVRLGEWQRVELYFRRSTTPTSRDGWFQCWQDGQIKFDFRDINYPLDGFADVGLTSIWDNGTVFPNGIAAEYHWYDHARVSTDGTPGGNPTDTDGDGIPDSSDQCPTLPGPGPTGCPPPTDTIAPMPPDQFEVTRQGGPILPPPAPTGPSSGGDAGFMF